jgi:hypothetical protein
MTSLLISSKFQIYLVRSRAIVVQLEREAADDAHEQAALQEDEELALTIHAGGELDQVRKSHFEHAVAAFAY